MKALARYALANTVSRAMRSECLTASDFEGLARAPSLPDFWSTLGKSALGEWLPPTLSPDALEVERLLHQATALRFRRVLRSLRRKPLELALVLLSRWDLDTLEVALRRWHAGGLPTAAPLSPTFARVLHLTDVLAAPTMEAIADALRHTPYAEPIRARAAVYEAKRSIAVVEDALERDHYQRLLASGAALGGADAEAFQSIVAAEIDGRNLAALARRLRYGPRSVEGSEASLIPGLSRLSRQLRRSEVSPELLRNAIGERSPSDGADTRSPTPSLDSIALLERRTDETLARLARRASEGFPFRFTCILAFYVFQRLELRNVRAVYLAKAAGLDADVALTRLHAVS